VAIIEQHSPQDPQSISFDQRTIALSASSVAILQSLGLWQAIAAAQIASPIQHIHVSDQGNFGFTRINAKEHQVAALGQVVTLETLTPILWQQIEKYQNIQVFCPAELTELEINANNACLAITPLVESSQPALVISSQLVLAADGTFSKVAKLSDISLQRRSYQQNAVISNLIVEKPHQNRAFERFTLNGPIAMLPLKSNQMGLVWCQSASQASATLSLPPEQFLAQLQAEFGYRLGKISKTSQPASYPLSLHVAAKPYAGRVLLLGNASHTLHPIAGQGLNLALRDIAGLNDILIDWLQQENTPQPALIGLSEQQCHSLIQAFVEARQQDWEQTINATDTLVKVFSQNFLPLVVARNLAMKWVNRCTWSKQSLAHRAMGFNGKSSRLARGLGNSTDVIQGDTFKVKDYANTI
jgi:2-octaprenyl-6-methoxyphenol hydroxylase